MGAAKLLCVVLFFFAISAVQSDTLEAVLTAQGLNTMLGFLKGSGFISSIANVTLFVPTDNAFTANMPPESDLPNVIRYHMVPGHILLQDLGDNQLFTTLFESRSVRTQIINLPGLNPAPKTVNGKVISAGDFISTEQNVVVHVIAGVLYPIPTQSIGEMLAGEPTLNITNNVVNQLKAVFDILNDTSRNLTLFAPTDDAWKAVDAKILQAINDHDLLVHLLSYHVVPDVIFSTYLPENMMFNATTLQGGSVTVVTSETGAVTINGVPLHSANALGTNGVYHSIDGILIPPFTVSDDLIYYNYTAFYAKLNSTDVFNTLLNVSAPALVVLALDDAAVAAAGDALTPDVLAYHIVIDSINDPTDHLQPLTLMALNGKPIFLSIIGDQKLVNGQTFTLVDKASNGFVASITSPLKPPAGSLLEALQDNPAVSSFVTIAKANNDVAAVLGNTSGLFTLFAPSNDALLKHPGLADLLTNATFVSQLLSLHVIPGVAFTKVVTTANSVASLEGTVLQFSVADNVLTVTGPQNAAMSVQTDIVATNGVAHIVDDVLLPTGFVDTTGAPTEAPTGSTDAPTDTPTGSTDAPTDTPTGSTDAPTDTPTVGTDAPTTAAPTTAAPTTAAPTTTTTKAPTTTTTTTTKSGASFAAPSFVLLAFLALFRLF